MGRLPRRELYTLADCSNGALHPADGPDSGPDASRPVHAQGGRDHRPIGRIIALYVQYVKSAGEANSKDPREVLHQHILRFVVGLGL